jgi:CcmD family protein
MTTTPDTFPSLFAGYAVIWIFIVGYLFLLTHRLNKIERAISVKMSKGTETDDSKK